jgi:hypothetical protein
VHDQVVVDAHLLRPRSTYSSNAAAAVRGTGTGVLDLDGCSCTNWRVQGRRKRRERERERGHRRHPRGDLADHLLHPPPLLPTAALVYDKDVDR